MNTMPIARLYKLIILFCCISSCNLLKNKNGNTTSKILVYIEKVPNLPRGSIIIDTFSLRYRFFNRNLMAGDVSWGYLVKSKKNSYVIHNELYRKIFQYHVETVNDTSVPKGLRLIKWNIYQNTYIDSIINHKFDGAYLVINDTFKIKINKDKIYFRDTIFSFYFLFPNKVETYDYVFASKVEKEANFISIKFNYYEGESYSKSIENDTLLLYGRKKIKWIGANGKYKMNYKQISITKTNVMKYNQLFMGYGDLHLETELKQGGFNTRERLGSKVK